MVNVVDNKPNKKERNSSVELIKIIAIFLIVLSHVIQTYEVAGIFNPNIATSNIKYLILIILRYSGIIGNTIFFASTAYFLVDNNTIEMKKIFRIIFEVWLISFSIFFIYILFGFDGLNKKDIIKSLMPITFNSNWYITCYLLFYPMHVLINRVIQSLKKSSHLKLIIISSVLYLGLCFIKKGLFFQSVIIIWTIIYLIVAYYKKYLNNMCKDRKKT